MNSILTKQELGILDLSGNILTEQKVAGKNPVDISFLPEGVFMLRVKNNALVYTRKLVVIR